MKNEEFFKKIFPIQILSYTLLNLISYEIYHKIIDPLYLMKKNYPLTLRILIDYDNHQYFRNKFH